MGCGASKDSGDKKAGGMKLKKLDAVDVDKTAVVALDTMFVKVKDPMAQIVEINNAVYDAVTSFVDASKQIISTAGDLKTALQEVYKQLKAANCVLEVKVSDEGVPEFTLLDAKKGTPIVGSGTLTPQLEEIWDKLKALPTKFKKIYEAIPPIKDQIMALVDEVKVFTPEKIKESVTAANLGFMEAAKAIKNAGQNVKTITRLPDIIKSMIENVKATVDEIKSVLDAAKELVDGPAETSDPAPGDSKAAPAATTTSGNKASPSNKSADGKKAAVKA